MKTYNVFFDIKLNNGVLEEKSIRVAGNTKHDALIAFGIIAPLNSIFRYVKTL